MDYSSHGRFRTKLCRNFALGHCPQGENCNYIHASPESIQMNNIAPVLQASISQRSHDDQLPSTTFSPQLWPTLSPTTNASSEHYNYNWSTSSTTGLTSSHIKYKPLSWRTTLCRHYLKSRGWCPLGDGCNYIHDLTLADFAKDDVRFSTRRSFSGNGGRYNERGKAGSKHSHCWAYVQGLCHVQDCQYLHPVAIQMFAPHTPCLAWPNCRRGPLCPYKHPEPYVSTSPSSSPAQTPAAADLPRTESSTIPRGVVQHNGMFYFNVPHVTAPPPPPPPPLPIPPPQPQFVFTNPWEGWQLPYTPTATMAFPPIAVSPPAWTAAGLSLIDCSNRPPVFAHVPRPLFSEPPVPVRPHTQMANYTYHPVEEVPPTQRPPSPSSFSALENDFPYVAPKEQRVGHARRVSVTIKSKEDLDALGLDSGSSHGRSPWQTHNDRLARRSWAPSSSTFRAAATPPPALYGV